MSAAEYGRLSLSEDIPLNPRTPPITRKSLDNDNDASSSASSTEYKDHLDVNPFDEKGERFRDDPRMEVGDRDERSDGDEEEEGEGYVVERRRVSCGLTSLCKPHEADADVVSRYCWQLRPRKKSRTILAILIAIVTVAGAIGFLAATGYSAPSYYAKSGTKHMTMDHVFNGTFGVRSRDLNWVKEGMYLY